MGVGGIDLDVEGGDPGFLLAPGKTADQRVGGGGVAPEGGLHHDVVPAGQVGEAVRVVQPAGQDDRLHALRPEDFGLAFLADESCHGEGLDVLAVRV